MRRVALLTFFALFTKQKSALMIPDAQAALQQYAGQQRATPGAYALSHK